MAERVRARETKILNVKMHYEDRTRQIPATEVKEEGGKLLAFDNGTKVADFPLDRIEHWSFEKD